MTCLLWKETLRMPPEWKKSTNCFRLFIYKSKDLILDINPPNNVFSPYLTLPIMASFFVSGKPIHTLGCVVSEYMCQKKEKYTQSLSILKFVSYFRALYLNPNSKNIEKALRKLLLLLSQCWSRCRAGSNWHFTALVLLPTILNHVETFLQTIKTGTLLSLTRKK